MRARGGAGRGAARIGGVLALLAAMWAGSGLHAEAVKRVVRSDGGNGNLLRPDLWQPYGRGFEREGGLIICDNADDPAAHRGAAQYIALNQSRPLPIIATAHSRAIGVSGAADNNYALYLDITYTDGSHLWGRAAPFDTAARGWQEARVRIMPEKPVRTVAVYLLLRGRAGRAEFRDARLEVLDPRDGAYLFDGQPVRDADPPAPRFLVRDVAADSDFESFDDAGRALGLRLEASSQTDGHVTTRTARLTSEGQRDRAVTLIYTLPVRGENLRWLADPRRSEPVQPPREYLTASFQNAGANGLLSRYPLAAIASEREGRAICLDMARPAFYRVGFAAGSGELYIAYDVALTPERPAAEFRFVTYAFDPAWGFRSAVAGMHRIFPDHFRSRTPRQGLWMPFRRISLIEGFEDFGFQFKESDDETAWDDKHGITTFRYTEPLTWWMPMPSDMPRTPEAAEAEARRLAAGDEPRARALLTSGYHDRHGRLVAQIIDRPWNSGAVWSMNSMPGIPGDHTDFSVKWNPRILRRRYTDAQPDRGVLDGEYIDSSEGYVSAPLDFRRDHFRAAQTPLTYAHGSNRPAIFRGLIAFEYIRAIAGDMRAIGKLTMANGTPADFCFLAPYLDVLGTETDWNPGGTWTPMPDADLIYRRTLAGPKPYCFLMNTEFDRFPHELVERYFKRCLAYGMFPGFFSHNAAENHYFSRPDLYNRDRPLFRKYIPLIRKAAEAGWRPITAARTEQPRVYVERFGQRYLTVFNDDDQPTAARVELVGLHAAGGRDLVSDRPISVRDGRFTIDLGAEDVALIELE